MLNPGSAGYDEKISPKLVETKLDQALHKIKAEMIRNDKLNWVQVLNLFDVKNPKSLEFFAFLREAKKLKNDIIDVYSLFTNIRKQELYEFIKPGEKVYLAWGTNSKKEDYIKTEEVMTILEKELKAKIVNERSIYYHPLLRRKGWFQIKNENFSI